MPALAGDAALGARLRAQALERDVLAAVHAYTVAAIGHALERGLQRAQLAEVARHLGFADIGEQVRHRLVGDVRCRSSDVRVGLGADPLDVAAQLLEQLVAARVHRVRQFDDLSAVERHGGS